jgi:hypothetical protein
MENECVFSACRRYRYLLVRRWEPLVRERACAWICLNPSVADETRTDPTLIRIQHFSARSGYNAVYLANLFAFVSSDRAALKHERDPVGPDNDDYIRYVAERVTIIFLGWGAAGSHQGRDRAVLALLTGCELSCFARTADGSPRHPLYLSSKRLPIPFHDTA